MAYVDGKWLDREERQERIDLLTERVRKLVALIKAGKATEYHIDTFRKDKAELTKLKRVHKAEVDIAYFTYEYLSDGLNPDNEDNVVRNADDGTPHDGIENIAKIHEEFFDLCNYVNNEKGTLDLRLRRHGDIRSPVCFRMPFRYIKRPFESASIS